MRMAGRIGRIGDVAFIFFVSTVLSKTVNSIRINNNKANAAAYLTPESVAQMQTRLPLCCVCGHLV